MKKSGLIVGSVGVALSLIGAASAEAGAAGDVATAITAPTFKNYVALGDSYTAAPLVPPLDLTTLGCMRSGGNYPALLAPKLKVPKVKDVSCGGADTTHLTTAQATPVGFMPPQFDALTKQTDLVTVGIGANDFGLFADLLAVCPSLQKSDPNGAPCKKQFTAGGKDQLKENVAKTKTRLVETLKTLKARIAPKATIVLVGYPRIAPAKGTCPELPLAKGDYAYVNTIETELNNAIQAAAKAGGAKYVDVFKPSEGHDICGKAKAWIQGKDIDLLKAASYHPRAEEQAAVADLIAKLLTGRSLAISTVEQQSWAPAIAARQRASENLLAVPAHRAAVQARLRQSSFFPAP